MTDPALRALHDRITATMGAPSLAAWEALALDMFDALAAEAAPLDVVDAAQAFVDEWDAAMAGDVPLNGHYQKQALDRLRAALAATSREEG